MPPRFISVFIVVAWLATMGWFAYREWWPMIAREDGPPFTIELADEAAPQIVSWVLLQGDQTIGTATTRMTYQNDDTFLLENNLKQVQFGVKLEGISIPITIRQFATRQRVTREGKLLAVENKFTLEIVGIEIKGDMEGEVREGKLYSRGSLQALTLRIKDRELAPVDLKAGSMWNPMHPVAKIRVRPGQQWRLTAMDPLGDALSRSLKQLGPEALAQVGGSIKPTESSLREVGPRVLHARVSSETQTLTYRNRTYTCHVIEYRDADEITQSLVARTWIECNTARVIRQEAILMNDRLILQRDE